jgi:hypothetical protein
MLDGRVRTLAPLACAVATALALHAAGPADQATAQAPPRAPRSQGSDQEERSVNWSAARAAADKYRATTDLSGLVQVDGRISRFVDPEDLKAMCRARQDAVVKARRQAEADLVDLGTDSDPVVDDRRAALHRHLGAVASFVGDVKGAISHFEKARDALGRHVAEYPDLRPRLLELEQAVGVANLRKAEVENCLQMPGSDRCLFPLRRGGQHNMHPEGAQNARARFQAYLALEPKDLETRWLLNVAHMALGEYPATVPTDMVFPPEVFKSEADLPRFLDVSRESTLGRLDIAGGTITDDFDGDGLIDVVFSSVDFCAPLRLYRNKGDGTFEDRSAAARIMDQLGGLNLIQTDYNNDGKLDIFVMRGGWEVPIRNSLLRNNGDGTFTDVTREAGLSSGAFSTHSVAWADYDNDGWLDVFVGHELAPSKLFRNRGNGTFEDVTAKAGVGANAFTKGMVFGDYDNDGWPDLYVSNMYGHNFLYRNNGNGTFTDVAAKLGVQRPFVSFPTWMFDYDNDGWLDIFVASYPNSLEEFVKHYAGLAPAGEVLALYRNNGKGGFTDVGRQANLARIVPAMGANFGDLDNDGFLDMYLGTGTPAFGALMPNVMFRNDAGRRFQDVTEATGTGHLQKGHGVAFADLDNDGDQDVVLNVGGAVPGDDYDEALFENPGTSNNWLAIRLIGTKSNRAAVGARIRLTLPGEPKSARLRHREVTSGGSFGANSLMQHIGVGKAAKVETVEVFWPTSRTTQTFRDVPVNGFLEITEGADAYEVRDRPAFRLGTAAPKHAHPGDHR